MKTPKTAQPNRRARVRRKSASVASSQKKAPTGIIGFDEITGGGLPKGRTTLAPPMSGRGNPEN